MKKCADCGKEKDFSEFYSSPGGVDGVQRRCKACAKARSYDRRHKNPEARKKVLEHDRQRGNRQSREYRLEVRNRNQLAYRARTAVGNAVRSGRLVRPEQCQHCSKECKPHGHHEDYSKPLAVVWLCAECHRNLHSFYETVGHVIPGAETVEDSAE